MNASACSTVVVGKDVSATGQIMIGHNEDNDLRIVTSQYWVPAADHKAGELITYEPTTAKIPQVAHTYGFYWTQTLHPDGYSFSDGFVNENGVAIVTNNCNNTFEEKNPVVDGGVGYGIRRLLAERAKSARDAVDIAIDLVTKYGYITGGRTYTVADHNEAWQIMLLKGHRYIARKVQNDEVTYIANAFAFDKVDVNSKDVIMSPDLIEHAIKTGHYKPAKAGDYSDFSFRKAYQPIERRSADWNKDRAQTAWEMLMGKETMDQEAFPYSVKPTKKLTVSDVQKIVSGHWKREARTSGFFHQSMRDICNVGTFESVVYQIAAYISDLKDGALRRNLVMVLAAVFFSASSLSPSVRRRSVDSFSTADSKRHFSCCLFDRAFTAPVITLRGDDGRMSHRLPHGVDVGAGLKEPRRKGAAQIMWREGRNL